MVAPIGKSANKLSFSLSNFNNSAMDPLFNNPLPAMPSESSIGMVNQKEHVLSNQNKVWGRNIASSNLSSREPSMVSSGHSTPYCDHMDMDLDEAPVSGGANIGSPELSYETEQDRQGGWLWKLHEAYGRKQWGHPKQRQPRGCYN